MGEQVEQLVVAVVRVYRHDSAAQGIEGEIVMEELGPLLRQQRDSVAAPVAGLRIAGPQGSGLRAHCFVAELEAVRVIVAPRVARRA